MKLILRAISVLLPLIALCACSDPHSGEPGFDDQYLGPHCSFTLGAESEGLSATEVTVTFLSDDGVLFTRSASHARHGDASSFRLAEGLAEGSYRLIDMRYNQPATKSQQPGEAFDDNGQRIFGLGSRISVTSAGISVTDSFNPTLRMAGEGTKDNPFIISSSTHFFNLMMAVNDYDINGYITEHTYFRQVCDIDMKSMSRSCDSQYGWMPIGADTNTPFRGVFLGEGHAVKNLIINRPNSTSTGLFGNVHNAVFDNLHIVKATVTGQYGVGAVAGAVITAGDNDRGQASFTNCSIEDCTISAPSTGAAVGGVLGATDMHARAQLSDCTVSGGSLTGAMNVGGVTGGAGIYSSIFISGCTNSSPVTAYLSGAGGMVGTADTLQVVGCRNKAEIRGGVSPADGMPAIGAGGIAGGSGFSWITGCTNDGNVSGYEGTGGIIGSTRVKGSASEAFVYNQSVLRWCSNTGNVSGSSFTGGAIGEAQAGTYGVVNTGKVTGSDYVGGICGSSSVAVLHNTVNDGAVEGNSNVGGVLGKCTWGSLAILQNSGQVTGKSGNTAGIVAMAGNNTIINYCSNFGRVTGPKSGHVGGIAGEIGDPRKWTGMAIAECVVGSLECVMGLAGPCLAIAEGAIEMAEGVEIAIKIVETGIEAALQTTDYVLVGYSISELISPEAEEELSETARVMSNEAAQSVRALMDDIRSRLKGEMPNFPAATLADNYKGNVEKLVGWYETGENDEIFNEAINETREERAGKLEKIAKAKEITHTVVAGVAVAVSTVTAIAGTVASGGTATAFMLAGASAAIVGGVNAITKSCNEFEKNAVVISQCVNAAKVSSHGNDNCASICGKICDGCLIKDCLSTADTDGGGYDVFTGGYGNYCDIYRCVSLVMLKDFDLNPGYLHDNVFCDPGLGAGKTKDYNRSRAAAPDRMSDPNVYKNYSFTFGTDNPWIIPEGAYFPIPSKSQMQK